MRTRMRAVVVVVLILAGLAAAQSNRGGIAGTVTDQKGAPLPGVTVSVSGPERRTTVTGDPDRVQPESGVRVQVDWL